MDQIPDIGCKRSRRVWARHFWVDDERKPTKSWLFLCPFASVWFDENGRRASNITILREPAAEAKARAKKRLRRQGLAGAARDAADRKIKTDQTDIFDSPWKLW